MSGGQQPWGDGDPWIGGQQGGGQSPLQGLFGGGPAETPWWQQQPGESYGQGAGAGRFLGPVAGDGSYGLQPWSYQVPDVTYEPRYLESEPVNQVLKKQKKKAGKSRGKQGGEGDKGGRGGPQGADRGGQRGRGGRGTAGRGREGAGGGGDPHGGGF